VTPLGRADGCSVGEARFNAIQQSIKRPRIEIVRFNFEVQVGAAIMHLPAAEVLQKALDLRLG
jgi:hypothetical protein